MKQYETFELKLTGPEPEGSYVAVDLKAVFTNEDSKKETAVEGFYAGNGEYRVRFYPSEAGSYSWKVTGLVSAEGKENCQANTDPKAGMIRAEGTHFKSEGGAYFYPFGTTVYAMMHQTGELVEETFASLAEAPFNKVRLCLFPKHYQYNDNDPEYFPFERNEQGHFDVNRPCFAFWDLFESRLLRLKEMGIQTDLILFHPYDDTKNWGFSLFRQEENLTYLDYLLRRFSAIPSLWWSMANEYDLCSSKSLDDWFEIEEFITAHDAYGHLLSNHQCFKAYDYSRENITHQSSQTIYFQNTGAWLKQFEKPLIYDEICYEGNLAMTWGNISGFEMANRFWATVCAGAYCTHGEVFLDEKDVLWWAKGGKLKGQSPARIAYLRQLVESLPGPIEFMEEDRSWMMDPETAREMGKMLMQIPGVTPDMMQNGLEGLPPEILMKIAEHIPILKAMLTQTESEKVIGQVKDTNYFGHVGRQVYLGYFGHHCNGTYTWMLPAEGSYRIDVIDIWEMTRTTILEHAKGRTDLPLPGKEGIAILASLE